MEAAGLKMVVKGEISALLRNWTLVI